MVIARMMSGCGGRPAAGHAPRGVVLPTATAATSPGLTHVEPPDGTHGPATSREASRQRANP